jgi:hypothetical protein
MFFFRGLKDPIQVLVIAPSTLYLRELKVRGNAVGAQARLEELADSVGRAVASKLQGQD